MAITTYPASVVSPYAPVILVQDTGTFTLTPYLSGDFAEITLQREVKDGKATFDLSAILRTTFRNVQTPASITSAPGLVFVNDGLLNGILFRVDSNHFVTALRGVAQRGNDNDMHAQVYPPIMLEAFRFGRDTIQVPKYEDFPLEIGLFAFDADDAVLHAVTDNGEEYDFERSITTLGCLTLDCTPLSVLEESRTGKTISFYAGCTPDDPVYVRWINTIGAWEYFMFSGSRGLGQRVERGDTFALAGAYDIDAKETTGELPPTVTVYITCGAEQLERPEFEALKTIATSPYVQIYDTERKAFTRCLVNGTDIVWNTQASRGQIDLELTLMTPYTQF